MGRDSASDPPWTTEVFLAVETQCDGTKENSGGAVWTSSASEVASLESYTSLAEVATGLYAGTSTITADSTDCLLQPR